MGNSQGRFEPDGAALISMIMPVPVLIVWGVKMALPEFLDNHQRLWLRTLLKWRRPPKKGFWLNRK